MHAHFYLHHFVGNIDCSQCEGECLVMDSVTRCVCGKEFILGVDGRSCQRSEGIRSLLMHSIYMYIWCTII